MGFHVVFEIVSDYSLVSQKLVQSTESIFLDSNRFDVRNNLNVPAFKAFYINVNGQ